MSYLYIYIYIYAQICVFSTFVIVTYPLDLTKTRLQIQGEGGTQQNGGSRHAQPKYRGMLSTAVGIVREEGPFKLWQGVTPAIYRHIGKKICISLITQTNHKSK